jgi:hypothetical protein
MIARNLSAAATPARLDELLAWSCADVAEPAARERLRGYGAHKLAALADLASTLHTADDEPELVRLLAACWLELRCEWECYNNVSNYHLFNFGTDAQPEVMAAAALTSGMLGWIEEVVPGQAVELMSSATIDLLDRIRADVLERASGAGAAAPAGDGR